MYIISVLLSSEVIGQKSKILIYNSITHGIAYYFTKNFSQYNKYIPILVFKKKCEISNKV